MTNTLEIRDIATEEHEALGRLMVRVYSGLDGFPSPAEQPKYYEMLMNIGRFAGQEDTRVLVAISADAVVGGVVYLGDMARYGSGGTATSEQCASGIRLLGVDPEARGAGIGKALTLACIELAKERGHEQVILHTTPSMSTAWGLYERLGFKPSSDLDFSQQGLPVYGFRLFLNVDEEGEAG